MEGFLALGFLFGMQHALEADHLAAVGAMAIGARGSKRGLALRGALWGLGHTITLFAICAAVILLGLTLTDRLAAALEFGVGVMLVLLGLDVLRRLRRQRIHFHAHRHGEGRAHLHAHGHAGATRPHDADPHRHQHPSSPPLRALFVGLMHGAAGSAGLLALAVAATRDAWLAVGYVLVFGLGSMLGMATLSFVAAWPLGAAERHASWLYKGLSFAAAALALGLGADVMIETGRAAWGGF
ncbi:urease accessory protein [Tistlia consotensis]|uniref:ABC-type nickel/cobalt efflux system, permease component RcnA n=2 Tax=Tistlia TaxID=1321364 RepID=A0A1Y6BW71_9PROT|nr:urease accessory protein [Tistlia consotensis]SMF30552.1 ABC-type nickel/cobalt efflux system, permease component RcnA [Tistlia consotensis USBA 355]